MIPKFDLAILIRTLPDRTSKLDRLLSILRPQYAGKSVQVIWLGDNYSMSAGAKLNALRSLALGVYSCIIDDDDLVSGDFVVSILEAALSGKKVITFEGRQLTNGIEDLPFVFGSYSRNHRGDYKGKKYKRMTPNHLCAFRTDIALREKFLDINLGEDHRWAEVMQKHYTKDDIHHIDKSLYIYDYNSNETKTRRR